MAMMEEWSQHDRDALAALFVEAHAKGLWFFHGGLSGPLWFSPNELEKEQAAGRFVWGAVNWRLRNPRERLVQIDDEIESLIREKHKFIERIGDGSP